VRPSDRKQAENNRDRRGASKRDHRMPGRQHAVC